MVKWQECRMDFIMDRVIVLQKVIDRRLTQVEAANELEITDRQVRRLLRKLESLGTSALISAYVGSNKKFKDSFREKAMNIIKTKYHDFGPKFASEKLYEEDGFKVSRETLRHWMIEDGLWHGKRRKKARIHQSKERRSRFGELVQIDGSPHDWFEGRAAKCCLLTSPDG